MMRFYIPHKCRCWGDNITMIWAAEYIKNAMPDAEIIGTFLCPESSYTDWIDLPWVTQDFSHHGIILTTGDLTVLTHHWHHKAVAYYEPKPYFYFDAHGIFVKYCIYDCWPTFIPNETTLKAFEELNLPENYNVIHWTNCRIRVKMTLDEALKKYPWVITENTVSTGLPITGCRDLSHLPGLLKQYVLIKAQKVYATHSGFTAIAAVYRKKKDTYLLAYDKDRMYGAGPPVVCYTNCEVKANLNAMHYALENGLIEVGNYFDYCKSHRDFSYDYPDTKGFPDFDYSPDPAPLDYKPKPLYFDMENNPVPANIIINMKEIIYG
jgi:hypothetical protein